MPDSGDPDELGASDEVITYVDEGENGEDSAAEIQASDLADIKNSLVNESAYSDPNVEIENQSAIDQKDNSVKPGEPFNPYSLPALLQYPFPHHLSAAHKFYPFGFPGLSLPAAAAAGLTAGDKGPRPPGLAGPATSQPPYNWPSVSQNGASSVFPPGLFRPPTYQQLLSLDPSRAAAAAAAQGASQFPPPGGVLAGPPPPGPPGTLSPSIGAQGQGQDGEMHGKGGRSKKSNKPYVKKPLNAFMLFMKENREKVMQESTLKESAAINQILGRKWHQLERSEQNKYYEMAKSERVAHQRLHPSWSARDNYATSKHRKRRKRAGVPGAPGGPGGPQDGMSSEGTGSVDGYQVLNMGAEDQSGGEAMDSEVASKKCRARFGLEKQEHWCKHCRRKKKCSVFVSDDADASADTSQGNASHMEDDDDEECSDSEECILANEAAISNPPTQNGGARFPHSVGHIINNNNDVISRSLVPNASSPLSRVTDTSNGINSSAPTTVTPSIDVKAFTEALSAAAANSASGLFSPITSSTSPFAPSSAASGFSPAAVAAAVFSQPSPLAISPFPSVYSSSSLYNPPTSVAGGTGAPSPFSPLQSIVTPPLFSHHNPLPFSPQLFPQSLHIKEELVSRAAAAAGASTAVATTE